MNMVPSIPEIVPIPMGLVAPPAKTPIKPMPPIIKHRIPIALRKLPPAVPPLA